MRNFAQFKKALAIGTKWTMEHASNHSESCRPPMGITVIHVQTNGVAFQKDGMAYNGNPYKEGTWLHFDGENGKASNWSFPDESTAVFTFPSLHGNEPSGDNRRMIYRKAS